MSYFKVFFALILCVFLTGCSEKVWIVKPIDVSLSNQSAVAKFRVSENGGYRVALFFVWGKSKAEMDRQKILWGRGDKRGTPIPIRLRILKDGKPFFDEVLVTSGISAGQDFEYEGVYKSTQVRDIKNFALAPGDYSFEVLTVEGVKVFEGTEGYVGFSYYDPKI
ncbi:hypothetical protein PSCICO_24600 [Pseudomonas cichorii]|uniref:DUF5625 family protein n=1 Tax=Pseudomonas cichorii TaxID=36746 RepID=UPI001910733E|nr:DUF5625 family protein [Pseudomonas cichorii]MBX8540442.1 hypothetical protein [Pseudomonas cichorii]MBX8544742.1 hypothetical protein [Pseudomonas cichorii]MBX8548882.1 hypothetical protein [Pseudomonas cichorii]MBX8563207.1 hypothetical protein [Pseudomonas cichorii]MBX8580165.1 hypothetical protein [Pseudomonas cichorii]